MLFGIMSHSGLCTYFGIMLFGIMSHLGLCPIRNYIAFRLMSLGAMSFRLMLFGAMSFDLLSENRFFLFFNFSPRQRSYSVKTNDQDQDSSFFNGLGQNNCKIVLLTTPVGA